MSMDLLEESVRRVEEYMGLPLPTRYVGLLYEHAVTGGFAGTNFGTHIAVRPEYDVGYGSEDVDSPGVIVAHEVAHYYWTGNADWLDEGAANILATLVENGRTGRPVVADNRPCSYARSIEELEQLDSERGDVEFDCNYSLGERLFLDLRRTLGGDRFRKGFRDLYLAAEGEESKEGADIRHVAEAFRSEDGAESTVIARWYDGSKPYEFTAPRIPAQSIPYWTSINGRTSRHLRLAGTERTGGLLILSEGCTRLGLSHHRDVIRDIGAAQDGAAGGGGVLRGRLRVQLQGDRTGSQRNSTWAIRCGSR